MRITKETLRQAFKAGIDFQQGEQDSAKSYNKFTGKEKANTQPNFDNWYKKLTAKKEEEVLGEEWVDFSKEKPVTEDYYMTKVRGLETKISDWWNGELTYFT